MTKNEILSRAVKTFLETAFGYFAVNLGSVALDCSEPAVAANAILCVMISAVAAGTSAVWNGVIEPLITLNKD